MESLIIVANPGSASRKYALYRGGEQVARVHIEYVGADLVAHVKTDTTQTSSVLATTDLKDCAKELVGILESAGQLDNISEIGAIAVRIVAPSSDFLSDQILDDAAIDRLEARFHVAPIHIAGTLNEIKQLKANLPGVPIIGMSDSSFHITKPDYAWNYGISLDDADRYEIKRYGYHGISLESVIGQIERSEHGLPSRVVVCHLGSGASITAVRDGESVDNTMGYSPLEGIMMSTRSGTLEFLAGLSLARQKNITPDELAKQLNNESGLLGVSGTSADIRELVETEKSGDYRAKLALSMYVYKIQQAIGQMAAALKGIDALVFTGTVGQRSFVVRERVVDGLGYLGFELNSNLNNDCFNPTDVTIVSDDGSQPVIVLPTDEELVMCERALAIIA